MAFARCDRMHWRNRQTSLCYARDERDVGIKSHATQTTMEHTTRFALPRYVSVTAQRKLNNLCAARCQATKHITTVGTLRQFCNQFRNVRRLRVGME